MTEVLIHLNISVPSDDPADAVAEAIAYCEDHGIPADDVALIDPQ